LRILEANPEGLGFAPENDVAKADIRQLLFGRYRVLYTLRGNTVFIVAVRHGARLPLTGEEVDKTD